MKRRNKPKGGRVWGGPSSKLATPAPPYRSLPGPPGPESRKSPQRVSRGLPAPGVSLETPVRGGRGCNSKPMGTFERLTLRERSEEKRGGGKPHEGHPSQKGVLDPPLVRYVFHPPQVSVLCFSCTKIHDRVDQKLFWRGPKIFGRARSLVRSPPPIRFCTPHITAQERDAEIYKMLQL